MCDLVPFQLSRVPEVELLQRFSGRQNAQSGCVPPRRWAASRIDGAFDARVRKFSSEVNRLGRYDPRPWAMMGEVLPRPSSFP